MKPIMKCATITALCGAIAGVSATSILIEAGQTDLFDLEGMYVPQIIVGTAAGALAGFVLGAVGYLVSTVCNNSPAEVRTSEEESDSDDEVVVNVKDLYKQMLLQGNGEDESESYDDDEPVVVYVPAYVPPFYTHPTAALESDQLSLG